jgi:hypothetical protein
LNFKGEKPKIQLQFGKNPAGYFKLKNWKIQEQIDKRINIFISWSVFSVYSGTQRDRRQRALFQHPISIFSFLGGWSGCFTQSKHNIMKVVQS